MPVANLAIMMVPGLLVAGVNRLRPGLVSLRSAAFVFATLAIWGPLLRAPLYGAATLVLAAGAARVISRWVADHASGFGRFARYSLTVLVALVGTTAVVSCAGQALAESRARGAAAGTARRRGECPVDRHGYRSCRQPGALRLHPRHHAPPGALGQEGRAVRLGPGAGSLDVSRHIARFMTGQWPSTLGAHWQPTLSPAYPTLAEFLASRGYLTARLRRQHVLVQLRVGHGPGVRPLRGLSARRRRPSWAAPCRAAGSSRTCGARATIPASSGSDPNPGTPRGSTDRSSTGCPESGDGGRPFFAFLNYLDAHEPFPTPGRRRGAISGSARESPGDYKMLLEYWDRDKLKLSERDVELARDSYDNCIAALDRQVGSLLDELERRGRASRHARHHHFGPWGAVW